MMTDEKWLLKKMMERFKCIRLRNFQSCRIQSVSDLLAIYEGISFWIEGKAMPKRTSPIPYRPGQLKWMREMEDDGVACFVICLLTGPKHVAIFRPPDLLVAEPLDATDPDWPEKLEEILTHSHIRS